jgi:predicted membrane protein
MTEFNDFREQRRKWREERRKMKDELREKFRDHRDDMIGGVYLKGRAWTGVFILLIGIVALLKAALVPLPYWFFSWKMFLIALGVFIGIRHRFYGMTWLILILIGAAFLTEDIYPDIEMRRYTWPVILIILGILFIFRPRNRWHWQYHQKKSPDESGEPAVEPITGMDATDSKEDYINATSVFGGTKKNILSKKFKGGEIVNIFGGTELNLSQSDIDGEAIIEMTTIFGGTKLIIPTNWAVKSDAAVIFGGIEDKRPVAPVEESTHRVLRLKGTVIFGGIDIKSY